MADLERAAKALERIQFLLAEKSAASASRRFCLDWKATVGVASRGGKDTANALETNLRELLSEGISDVYFGALQDAGIDPQEFSEEDYSKVDDLTAQQFEFLPQFIDDIRHAAREKDKQTRADMQDAIMARADLWCNTVDAVAEIARNSAKKNEMVTWHLGATEKHCKTCAWLNGQRHRRSWFALRGYVPRQPGSDTLDCGGWNCDCSLEID